VKYLVALISLFLAGAPHFGSSAGRASLDSQQQNIVRRLQQATTTPGKSEWQEHHHACFPLKTDKPEKRSLSSGLPACFTVDVNLGEATQLWLDQPSDLEIHCTSKTAQMRVDGFEFGVETLTIAEPGSYRVQISKVDSAPGAVTFSIVRKKLEMQKRQPGNKQKSGQQGLSAPRRQKISIHPWPCGRTWVTRVPLRDLT
jgi:hypothetical protein